MRYFLVTMFYKELIEDTGTAELTEQAYCRGEEEPNTETVTALFHELNDFSTHQFLRFTFKEVSEQEFEQQDEKYDLYY